MGKFAWSNIVQHRQQKKGKGLFHLKSNWNIKLSYICICEEPRKMWLIFLKSLLISVFILPLYSLFNYAVYAYSKSHPPIYPRSNVIKLIHTVQKMLRVSAVTQICRARQFFWLILQYPYIGMNHFCLVFSELGTTHSSRRN